jgi:predicted ABC-type ATPase
VVEPCIAVLAGTNGAGKSSVGGEFLRHQGVPFFNPDEVARDARRLHPTLSTDEINALAWREGLEQLRRAIANRIDYAFETTLGGNTITRTLAEALDQGLEVRIWYVGLENVDLHIARVKARVARGGHAIPEAKIRERFDSSRMNLIKLMPRLAELKVFDNSADADPAAGTEPSLRLVLHLENARVIGPDATDLRRTPEWAKPIVAAALGA